MKFEGNKRDRSGKKKREIWGKRDIRVEEIREKDTLRIKFAHLRKLGSHFASCRPTTRTRKIEGFCNWKQNYRPQIQKAEYWKIDNFALFFKEQKTKSRNFIWKIERLKNKFMFHIFLCCVFIKWSSRAFFAGWWENRRREKAGQQEKMSKIKY